MDFAFGRVRIASGELFWERSGTGGVPVLFVHAFGVDRRLWDAEMAALAPGRTSSGSRSAAFGRTCLRYDLRGFGRSSAPDPTVPFAHHRDLLALVDALGFGEVDLVGLSLGGGVAIDFALANPGRVRRLVVIGSMLSGWRLAPNVPVDVRVWTIGREAGGACGDRGAGAVRAVRDGRGRGASDEPRGAGGDQGAHRRGARGRCNG